LVVAGWVVAHDSSLEAVRLVSTSGDPAREARLIPLNARELPEVTDAVPADRLDAALATGRAIRAEVSLLELAPGTDLEVRVVTASGDRSTTTRLGTITGIPPIRIQTDYRERTSPLLLTAIGRSGTTWMMGLLQQHPQVVVPGYHPFEYRQAAYLWHVGRILLSPGDFHNSMHPDSFEVANRYRVGFDPWNTDEYLRSVKPDDLGRWHRTVWPPAVVEFLKRGLDQFAHAAGAGRPGGAPRLIAEKASTSPLIHVISSLYPGARRVFLVRDFRDIYCSARAMNAKRGSSSFGREAQATELDWLAGFGRELTHLARTYRLYASTSTLVRYEDLVARTPDELARVFREVGVDHDAGTVRRVIEAADDGSAREQHQTASDTVSSVGRWRTELTQPERELVERRFAEVLADLGYALT
jgi:hypothetical protein